MLTVEAVPTRSSEPPRREIAGHDPRGGAAVWHNTEPGHLAWLECPNSSFDSLDGPTTLFTLDVSDPSADPTRVRSFDQGCRTGCWGVDEPCVTLAGWGSTGVWATKYPVGWEEMWYEETKGLDVIESVLVDADGAEIAMVSDAQMIAMRPDGTTVWQSDNWQGPYFVLSPDGQQRSTLPGLDDADPDRAARAAASASIGSDFPNRRRVCRFGWSTSTTTTPSLWRCRVRPTPYDPVPSTPTFTTGPNPANQSANNR